MSHRLPGVFGLRAAHAVQQTVHGENMNSHGFTSPAVAEQTPALFLRQFDWYTRKTSVVVDVVKREGEGDRRLLYLLP